MSTSVSSSFSRQYERDVHHSFQREGSYLLMTVRRQNNIVGKSTTFQRIGKGSATTKGRHGVIPPMNQDHTPVECVLEDFYAGDWVDKLDLAKLVHDERMAIAKGGAYALGRKSDSQIIDKLNTTTTAGSLTSVSTGGAALALMLELVEKLNSNDVPDDGDRWGIITPRLHSILMTTEQYANSDYVGTDSLPFMRKDKVKTWMGVNWMTHTDLPGVGTATARSFAYHRSAIGHASGSVDGSNNVEGVDVGADITWHGDRAAWWILHLMSGGSALIDPTGVAKTAAYDDTTAIPTS